MPPDEDLLHVWIESVKDFAIFRVALDGRVDSWNVGAERILGYAEPEILGQPFGMVFTPEDRQSGVPAREIREAETTERGWDDRWLVRKDGSRFWASGLLTPLRTDDGTLLGFVKVLRDHTERKRMEDELRKRAEELQEADRRKNEFLAMLSHELRNPLAPIMNSLYVLRQNPSADPAVNQSRAMIERQIAHLKQVVDDLIDVARVSSGKIQLRREQVRLADVVALGVEDVAELMSHHKHSLITTADPKPVWLDADPTRLEQVLTNLLVNAAKYTKPGGRIRLETQRIGDEVEIRVVDNGMGIDAPHLPRIFDLFAQADESLDRTLGGLGIGLTLCRTLVGLHGGSIEAHSEGLGKGSEFVVRLPVAPAPTDVDADDDDPGKTMAARSLRILVVDDNVDGATSLAIFLRHSGHTTAVAHDGAAAISALTTFAPDAVVLDIGLPGMSGYDVAQAMRAQTSATLIALSGYIKEGDDRDARFDHYLTKPVNPDELLKIFERLAT